MALITPSSRAFGTEALNVPARDDTALTTKQIHVLGLGSIGTLTAHSLKCLPSPPPISLLMHRPAMYDDFVAKEGKIILKTKSTGLVSELAGFDADVLDSKSENGDPYWRYYSSSESGDNRAKTEILPTNETFISSLIVTVKGPMTVAALRAIKHRVNADSTICFFQNGMGQIDELNREVFTDVRTRPTYVIGIVHHGAHMAGPFSVNHAGSGTIMLGVSRDTDRYPLPPPQTTEAEVSNEERKKFYPTEEELLSNPSTSYLLQTLTEAPTLSCTILPHLELLQRQLEKLCSNAILNPLTALFDVPNGSMLLPSFSTLHSLLLSEISSVLQALPELKNIDGISERFSEKKLRDGFMKLAEVTALNSSSMREDVRAGKGTEIGYINGFVVKRGEELGIDCSVNRMVAELVRGKGVVLEK